jgi:hypothetical protein
MVVVLWNAQRSFNLSSTLLFQAWSGLTTVDTSHYAITVVLGQLKDKKLNIIYYVTFRPTTTLFFLVAKIWGSGILFINQWLPQWATHNNITNSICFGFRLISLPHINFVVSAGGYGIRHLYVPFEENLYILFLIRNMYGALTLIVVHVRRLQVFILR